MTLPHYRIATAEVTALNEPKAGAKPSNPAAETRYYYTRITLENGAVATFIHDKRKGNKPAQDLQPGDLIVPIHPKGSMKQQSETLAVRRGKAGTTVALGRLRFGTEESAPV